MSKAAQYAKVVEWSEADDCFIGTAPGLIHGGCHGKDERQVFDDLCRIVEEAIELYEADGKALPPPQRIGERFAAAGET